MLKNKIKCLFVFDLFIRKMFSYSTFFGGAIICASFSRKVLLENPAKFLHRLNKS